MARYIDADALIRLIEIEALCQGDYFSKRDAIGCVKTILTADVVPKSEYDEMLANLQKIHDSYTADCIEHYNRGRSEVAREIFEEIERLKDGWNYIPTDVAQALRERAVAEAIKEFAERLKQTAYTHSTITGYQYHVVDVAEIDELVREMTEGKQ